MRTKSVVIVIGVIGAIAGAGVLYSKSLETEVDPQAAFATVPAARQDLERTVTATGSTSAVTTVSVGVQVSGRISEIFVDYNSEVQEGDLLARLDTTLFDAQLAQSQASFRSAEASLAEASVNLEYAEAQAERYERLAEQGFVAVAEAESLRAQAQVQSARVRSARAGVEQSRASLTQVQTSLGYTEIYSPVGGTVVSREVDVGQTVSASLSAPTLFVIAEDLRRMQVNTSVAESDVAQLREGMKASFTVDAFPGQTFDGTVQQVRLAATTTSNVVTYDAVVGVDNDEGLLLPGMTASVEFMVEQRVGALVVPNAALRFAPPEEFECDQVARGGRLLWVMKPDGPTCALVTLGFSDGSFTEIIGDAVHEGDAILTSASGGGASERTAAGRGAGGGGDRPARPGMGL